MQKLHNPVERDGCGVPVSGTYPPERALMDTETDTVYPTILPLDSECIFCSLSFLPTLMHFLLIVFIAHTHSVCQYPITVIVSQDLAIFSFCCHCVLVETFKSKSLSPRQSPEPPFRPDSKLTLRSWRTCVCLEPLGSRMNSGFRPGSAAIGKSTVWG